MSDENETNLLEKEKILVHAMKDLFVSPADFTKKCDKNGGAKYLSTTLMVNGYHNSNSFTSEGRFENCVGTYTRHGIFVYPEDVEIHYCSKNDAWSDNVYNGLGSKKKTIAHGKIHARKIINNELFIYSDDNEIEFNELIRNIKEGKDLPGRTNEVIASFDPKNIRGIWYRDKDKKCYCSSYYEAFFDFLTFRNLGIEIPKLIEIDSNGNFIEKNEFRISLLKENLNSLMECHLKAIADNYQRYLKKYRGKKIETAESVVEQIKKAIK